MKQLVAVAVAFSVLTGCKKTDTPAASGSATVGSAAPSKDDRDEMLEKMTELTDLVCACKDAACVLKVNDAVQAWTTDFAERTKGSTSVPTPEQMKKVEALQGRFVACVQSVPPPDSKP